MAVVNTKSTALSNADASPVTPNYPKTVNGSVRSSAGVVAKAAGDSNASTYRMVRVPSDARLIGRTLNNAALTGATDIDAGLYAVDDGAVVDADILEDGISLASAGKAFAPFGNVAAADAMKPLWELLGLSEDPQTEYDIVLTANTAGGGAGSIAMDVLWVV